VADDLSWEGVEESSAVSFYGISATLLHYQEIYIGFSFLDYNTPDLICLNLNNYLSFFFNKKR